MGDVSKINEYFSEGSKGSLSASTLFGRLCYYKRFVEFLRIEHSKLLHSQGPIQKIQIILKNLKEALGKDRKGSTHTLDCENPEFNELCFIAYIASSTCCLCSP